MSTLPCVSLRHKAKFLTICGPFSPVFSAFCTSLFFLFSAIFLYFRSLLVCFSALKRFSAYCRTSDLCPIFIFSGAFRLSPHLSLPSLLSFLKIPLFPLLYGAFAAAHHIYSKKRLFSIWTLSLSPAPKIPVSPLSPTLSSCAHKKPPQAFARSGSSIFSYSPNFARTSSPTSAPICSAAARYCS